MGFAPQLREVADRQGTHNHLGGGLGFTHLRGGQLDVGSGGGTEQVHPNQDAGGGKGPRAQEDGHGAAQNLPQAVHVGHGAHGAGDGHKDQGHHNGEQQVQKDVADGLQGLAQAGGDHADERAGGDSAKKEDGGLILLPEGLLSSLRSHDNISISRFFGVSLQASAGEGNHRLLTAASSW